MPMPFFKIRRALAGAIFLLEGLFMLWGPADAMAKTIHVEWSYPGNAANFILYLNGSELCRAPGDPPYSIDCTLPDPAPAAILVFTMVAENADDFSPSPPSPPYEIDLGTQTVTGSSPARLADQDLDLDIDGRDLAAYALSWNQNNPAADLDGDSIVTVQDIHIFSARFATGE